MKILEMISTHREWSDLVDQDNALRRKYRKLIMKIGDRCYDLSREGKIDDEELMEMCDMIADLRNKIDEKDAQIIAIESKSESLRRMTGVRGRD